MGLVKPWEREKKRDQNFGQACCGRAVESQHQCAGIGDCDKIRREKKKRRRPKVRWAVGGVSFAAAHSKRTLNPTYVSRHPK